MGETAILTIVTSSATTISSMSTASSATPGQCKDRARTLFFLATSVMIPRCPSLPLAFSRYPSLSLAIPCYPSLLLSLPLFFSEPRFSFYSSCPSPFSAFSPHTPYFSFSRPWLRTLRGRFLHQAVEWNGHMLIQGGFNGRVRGDVLVSRRTDTCRRRAHLHTFPRLVMLTPIPTSILRHPPPNPIFL